MHDYYMFGAVFITIIPTILASIVLPKIGFNIKSSYLKIAMNWFVGMYVFTIATFLIVVLFNETLFKASITTLVFFVMTIHYLSKKRLTGQQLHSNLHFSLLTSHAAKLASRFSLPDILIVLGCLLFSFFFFTPQLSFEKGAIYTSPVYWDFHWHAALIQNFSLGNNFPPENEAFSGVPHTYHYFWGVVTAIYEVLGLNLVFAINVVSILTFFFFLIAIIGISQEIFKSKITGLIAVILTLTSSSVHVVYYFLSHHQNLGTILKDIITSTAHPYYSDIYKIHDFTYNGTYFNLFYFLEERQLIFGVIYLLLSLWILYKREHFSPKMLVLIGGFMGAYFLWHLFVALTILWAILFLLLFDRNRKKTLFLFIGFCLVFGLHYLYIKHITQSIWFSPEINMYPKINFGFSDQDKVPFSLYHAIEWYAYAYGLKIILLPASILYLWFKNKKHALLLSSIIIPTFIAMNTIQLSPVGVIENHKWLRPMNVAVDLAIAAFIQLIFFSTVKQHAQKKQLRAVYTFPIWILLLFCLTASGIIELFPYFNTRPTNLFSYFPSSITLAIFTNTSPRTTFIGSHTNDIQLAGRKLFVGDTLGTDLLLDKQKREAIVDEFYKTDQLKTLCNLTNKYNIDYIESINEKPSNTLPHFSADSQTIFIDTKKACNHK